MSQESEANKLDFLEGVSFLPWDWRNLGAAYQDGRPASNQSVAARCSFTVRRGFDALDGVDYGGVLEGLGDVGLNLRSKAFAFHLGASNLAYKGGADDPLRAAGGAGGGRLASLKLAAAQEYAPDQYVAVSYDLLQRKPELALAWSGTTFTERATLSLHLDPVERACRLRAGVALPGPEWREDVYDEETGRVECPADDGARHSVWVEHEARRRQLMAATRLGGRVDLGRLLNWAADFVDNRLESKIPGLFWKMPFSQQLYNLVIPAEDENQERYPIRGLSVEFLHDFARPLPVLGLSKRLGSPRRAAAAYYDPVDRVGELKLRVGGLIAGMAVTRVAGAGWREWSAPSFSLSIEPLAFL